ncbi:MAG: DNA starvation/stationary phase protection protein [Flavobacteriales bacterium]|nr:DNA starvation/stationary phase protection protein [Flavobacteriales bacterium]
MAVIRLKKKESKLISKALNNLLANYQVFYMNARGYHWNIKGDKFFELHLKFEELYDDLQIKIDEIAERILTLGRSPLHTFEDYLKQAKIHSTPNVEDSVTSVKNVLKSLELLIKIQREILSLTEELDEGTNALMSDYIREQEKLYWMYSAFLNHKP